jgi:uncharacterized protein YfdQ (DUF2303 family)
MAPPNTTQVLPGDAEAIRAFAALAQQAAGEIDVLMLTPPEDCVGLPAEIPVAFRRGPNPQLTGVRELFDAWRRAPERRKGVAKTTTLASFIALTNYHKGEASALFAKTTWPAPALTAVIDYHAKDKADNCGHRVEYAFPMTDEFTAWVAGNGKPHSAFEFAAFVEDHIADLSAAMETEVDEYEDLFKTRFALPTEMIELSRGLRVNVEEKVVNAFVMQNGEGELRFSTEHKTTDGKPLVVPGLFMLCLPIFVDGSQVRIPARLRYRVKDGVVTWTYALYRWEYWLRLRVQSDLANATKQTALPAYEGAPEAS